MSSRSLEEQLEFCKRKLEVLHGVDRIRDIHQHEQTSEVAVPCLGWLAENIGVHAAFVNFHDMYGRRNCYVVNNQGVRVGGFDDKIEVLAAAMEAQKKVIREDDDEGMKQFLASPMIVASEYIGIIGVIKISTGKNLPAEFITDMEEQLIIEAATTLDTAIAKRCKDEMYMDELELVSELDVIADGEFFSLKECLHAMLTRITEKVGAKASLVFEDTNVFETPLGGDDTGSILWNDFDHLKNDVRQTLQSTPRDGRIYKSEFNEHNNDRVILRECVSTIVGRVLKTRNGEVAGYLAIVFTRKVHEGSINLIRRAARILDSTILTWQKTIHMVKRFGKHLGSEYMPVLLNNPGWLDPRQVDQVAMMSVDLVGSTEFAGQHKSDPYFVFQQINAYLELVANLARNDYGATLDKYIGDEVIALFGAPIPDRTGQAKRVMDCAEEILRIIEDFNEKRAKQDLPIFEVKIAAGLVQGIAGEVGSEDTYTEYTIIGPDVNELFRIARHAQDGKIILNKALYDAVKEDYDVSFWKGVEAKGVEGELPIYVVD